MTHYRLILLAVGMLAISACDKSDPSSFSLLFDEPATFSTDSEIASKQQQLLESYGVRFVTTFDDMFSHFEWTSSNKLDFVQVPADQRQATLASLDMLAEVLSHLPAEAISNLPAYVLLTDSIAFECNLVNYNNTADTLYTRQTLLAYDARTHVALAGFGALADAVPSHRLRQLWTAVIIAHWLSSLSEESYPQAFFDYATELQGSGSYNLNFTGQYYPLSVYPQYNMETYGCFDAMFRLLSTYYGYFMGDSGEPYRLSYDTSMTVQIDLACHLAFALYATDEEQAYYLNHPTANGAFVEKQRLAKEYAAEVLGWEI